MPRIARDGLPFAVTFKMVPASQFTVLPEVQRGLDANRARKLATEWDDRKVGVIMATRIDGKLHPIDGQHRVAAKRGADPGFKLPTVIFDGVSRADAATMFLARNKETKTVQAYDNFRIGLVAGVPSFVAIQDVLDSLGLRVGTAASTHTIGAVRALQYVFDRGARVPRAGATTDQRLKSGKDVLTATLQLLMMAYPDDTEGDRWQTDVMQAVGRFFHTYPDRFLDENAQWYEDDWNRLAAKVGQRDVPEWGRKTKAYLTETWGGSTSRAATLFVLMRKDFDNRLARARKLTPMRDVDEDE